ncbi:MAG: CinA family nicotinamide mononucleotide deamidase-related protein [Chloroflexota bacterium]
MRASILSIGSELLRGDIVDTNAAYLSRNLSQLGFSVRKVQQLSDDMSDLVPAIRSSLENAEITVCTGGLGPTEDDLTRQAIAEAVDEELYVDKALVKVIESRFAAMRRTMPLSNHQQAMLIPSAEALPNPNGSAPGWYVQKEGHVVVALPGPPGEMDPMWRDEVLPRIAKLREGATAMKALMTFGIGESTLERQISSVIHWHPDITIATYAKQTGVQVHITARAADGFTAQDLVTDAERRLRAILGDAVFGVNDSTLSSSVGQIMAGRGLTVAVMESCTGGELSSMFTDIPGSSAYFLGGMVAYDRKIKELYGVPSAVLDQFGLISGETAAAMARAARESLGSDVGIGTTGIAGNAPVEGLSPGTCFVAVHTSHKSVVRKVYWPGPRHTSKRYFAQCALDLLRLTLHNAESRIQ